MGPTQDDLSNAGVSQTWEFPNLLSRGWLSKVIAIAGKAIHADIVFAEGAVRGQNRRMIHSALGPIRVAFAAGVLLSSTGCGSNTANSPTEADAASPSIVDAGACSWPASVTSSGDASTSGCWAKPTFNICEVPSGGSVNAQDGTIRGPDGQVVTDACKDACSASEYALTCTGETMMPSSIPSPASSLGCTVIPVPTPSNALFYCCPCE